MMETENQYKEILTEFLDEAAQQVIHLNQQLLKIENGVPSEEIIPEMFRIIHSMKGSSGFLGLKCLNDFLHSIETVLDLARNQKLAFSSSVLDLLFSSFDCVATLIESPASGNTSLLVALKEIKDQLHSVIPQKQENGSAEESLGPLPAWLKEIISIDDILETLVAINEKKHVYAIKIDLHGQQQSTDLLRLQKKLEDVFKIQSVYPLIDNNADIWAPLSSFSYEIGLLCFCNHPIEKAMENSGLHIPINYWVIDSEKKELLQFNLVPRQTEEKDIVSLVIKPGMERHKALWIAETEEELSQLEIELLTIEKDPGAISIVNSAFRLLHRLKSSCSAMGFQDMAAAAHNGETLLDTYRNGNSDSIQKNIKSLFVTRDFLFDCLMHIKDTRHPLPFSYSTSNREIIEYERIGIIQSKTSVPDYIIKYCNALSPRSTHLWYLKIELFENTELPDLRYLMIIKNLSDKVTVSMTQPSIDQLEKGIDNPPSVEVVIDADIDKKNLASMTQFDLVKTIVLEKINVEGKLPGGSSVSESNEIKVVKVQSTSNEFDKIRQSSGANDTVRVDTLRLDEIMNVAGELVITKARVLNLADQLYKSLSSFDLDIVEAFNGGASRSFVTNTACTANGVDSILSQIRAVQDVAQTLRDTVTELHRHTSMVQNSVMRIRMVPIGPLFHRFHRLVRDLCKENGKKAQLIVIGESTELDKKIVDELTDPLTHIIRNCVDHGLEPIDERIIAGKNETGTIKVEAFHDGGQICIRVCDDGKGLNRQKIVAKAISCGLLEQGTVSEMSHEEIFNLIFVPGFSTADQITSISGRGVGMDIVRSKISEMKGKIELNSQDGKGVSFTLRLPLTLAMFNALIVRIGETAYAFPLETVKEIVDLSVSTIKSIEGKCAVVLLRNDIIPVLQLEDVIGIRKSNLILKNQFGIVVKGAKEDMVVAVDTVIGKEEIVVKSLPQEFCGVKGFTGATVLGNGCVALILDIHSISEIVTEDFLHKESVGVY